MNGNTLTNVNDPEHDYDVAMLGYAKEYAVNKSGDTMSSNLKMGGH